MLDVWYPDPQLGEPGSGDRPELQHLVGDDDARDVVREQVTTVVDLDEAPADTADVWLRLHLLSHRLVRPREADLTGVFGLLTNVVWTNHGPCAVEGFELTRSRLQRRGPVTVLGVDKFPRMVDYVLPAGVRVADADRVRLGAHLAAGTTVMHEGFVNYNAGTLGPRWSRAGSAPASSWVTGPTSAAAPRSWARSRRAAPSHPRSVSGA